MAKEHSTIISQIIKTFGNLPHSYLWSNQTGVSRTGGRWIPFGEKGSPDIIGCIRGQFIGVEVKVGKDKWRDDQKAFCERIKKAGGYYFLVKSVDDFVDLYHSITF